MWKHSARGFKTPFGEQGVPEKKAYPGRKSVGKKAVDTKKKNGLSERHENPGKKHCQKKKKDGTVGAVPSRGGGRPWTKNTKPQEKSSAGGGRLTKSYQPASTSGEGHKGRWVKSRSAAMTVRKRGRGLRLGNLEAEIGRQKSTLSGTVYCRMGPKGQEGTDSPRKRVPQDYQKRPTHQQGKQSKRDDPGRVPPVFTGGKDKTATKKSWGH